MKRFVLLLILALLLPAAGADSVKKLNDAFGINIFSAEKQWNFADLYKRSKLQLRGSNGRFNVRLRRKIAGAMAEEIVVYTSANNRDVKRISITFANKGDSGKRYKSMIKQSERAISDTLTENFGVRRREKFAAGGSRTKTDHWHTSAADLYLECRNNEFLILHIVPVNNNSSAAGGKKDYSKNVVRNKFGDVFIQGIPMVDQGPKGYCVPATIARVFLYFGCPLDMHNFAEIGETGRGGGTNFQGMIRQLADTRRKNGLRQAGMSGISLNQLAKYIDHGYPVVWSMYSTDELMKLYNFSRLNRSRAASPREWAKTVKRHNLPKSKKNPHTCLIIGYNPRTDEIAVSNSWGQQHIAPTWIPRQAAKKVSQNQLVVFFP